ncbi:hypothetical protein LTR78_003506 [Recurvomyces mirabilis]|uniref:Importin N-terminal domain-containing protein n=1 Tax=Recurvomyces mirabilis TaxID=574656 RepID=A0AAE1C3G0_9PEZI|nr:hypothetical protein LTR78_003506 [Recurvomyces mirabilis]KAK5154461.1 hypothetical protein LTS14_006596 [Recurvomyces mirabilis]
MPSFSIEVEGEVNPLTEHQLVQVLSSAASSDPTQIQSGTKQLQQWERSPGYYKHLQSAYIDTRLPVELRYLAVIQLKNGIDKYWRKTATNAVSKQDKEVIRSRLLPSILDEEDERLALQDALVIAKIARFEYPHEWPDALSSLVDVLRSQSQGPSLQLARTLLALLAIVKELSTARLQRSRQNLQAASPEIVYVLSSLYVNAVEYWQNSHSESAAKLALMAMKVLRRLLITGYEHPGRHDEVVRIWHTTQQHLQTCLQHRELEKLALQLAKLHHEMTREHPASFALLPNSMDLARAYWGLARSFGESIGTHDCVQSAVAADLIGMDGDADEKPTTEKLALRGLLILRACVKMVHSPAQTFKYRTPEDKEEKRRATELVRQSLLSSRFVQEIMEVVVSRFFVFRASDLRQWEEEPEEWEKREEGDGEDWEFSLRSCSEKLFLDLAINYKDMLVHPLLQVFSSVATIKNDNVLLKDALYTAIGLAAPVVFEQLDFDAFIRDVLVAEVQMQKPGYNVLRRRAAILLAQWIGVKITERGLVYQIFQHLLGKDDPLNDQVVRVTAGRQFATIVDDWETRPDELQIYAQVIIRQLMSLIEEVELTETKMALLNTTSIIVERMEHRISPFAEGIVSMLPALWESSGEEHLMKQAILTILVRLVNAMKAHSVPLHSMVLPIIRGAVQPGSDTEVYLLEDAMDLWGAIITQTPQPASQEALELVPSLFPVYEFGSEHLRSALGITESYVLLAPEFMLPRAVREPLLKALVDLLDALTGKPEPHGLVCKVVEQLIRAAERVDGVGAIQPLAENMSRTILPHILRCLRSSWVAHCTTGPKAKDPMVDGIVETDYFVVLARLILADLNSFSSAVEAGSQSILINGSPASLDETMKWLLEEWFSHLENIGDPSLRKLMALALTKLLETNRPFILLNLQSLMTMWTDVIVELREASEDAGNGDTMADSLVYGPAPAAESLESPEDARKRVLTCSDEVHTIGLPGCVTQALGKVVEACGGMERFQQEWLINVDEDVVAGFTGLGIM